MVSLEMPVPNSDIKKKKKIFLFSEKDELPLMSQWHLVS